MDFPARRPPRRRTSNAGHRSPAARILSPLALVVLVLGIALSMILAWAFSQNQSSDRELRFTNESLTLLNAAEAEVDSAFGRLFNVAAFLSAGDLPTQSQYNDFVDRVALEYEPWLLGLGFMEPVTSEGRDALVQREHAQGNAAFELKAAGSGNQIVVTRVTRRQEKLAGVNAAALAGIRDVLDRAAEAGGSRLGAASPAALARLTSLSGTQLAESDPLRGAVVHAIPVHDPDMVLRGWLVATIRPGEILDKITGDSNLALRIDHVMGERATLVARSGAIKGPDADQRLKTTTFRTGDIAFRAGAWEVAPPGTSSVPALVLLAGLVMTFSLAFLAAQRSRASTVAGRLSQSEEARRTDTLTGLPNRAGIQEILEAGLDDPRNRDQMLAVLFCDVDRFKVINDSLGHEAGDELLTAVANRLRDGIRPGDSVGRFGGDEFIIVCPGLASPEAAATIAQRILAGFARPVDFGDRETVIRTSIGIALGRAGGQTPAELVRDADAAMYEAKGTRRGYRIFDDELRARVVGRLAVENALRSGLREERLRVDYQPIVSAETRTLVGVEALVRLEHPGLGTLPPDAFIPVAREIGLLGEIGDTVLRAACRQMAEWNSRTPDMRPLSISVNVADSQLADPGFPDDVASILRETRIAPSQLVLELTEDSLKGHPDGAAGVLDRLAKLGVEISIDDFGTGESTLDQIADLRTISEVKIDRSFVAGLGKSDLRDVLVQAIADVARGVGARVVAEGVDTESQVLALERIEADRLQGFLFSHPMPPEALRPYILDRTRQIRAPRQLTAG